MTLELNKLTGHVEAMGAIIAERRDAHNQLRSQAKRIVQENPIVTEELRARIARAQEVDEWRRGADPLCERFDDRHTAGPAPSELTLIAADGSQIYPDRHGIADYFLINTGSIVFRKGASTAPSVASTPEVFFEDRDILADSGEMLDTEAINALRDRRELATLTDLAASERAATGGDLTTPILAVMDGPMLPWPHHAGRDPGKSQEEIRLFAQQIDRLRSVHAIPVGYVDRPGSANVLRSLELIHSGAEEMTREKLRAGSFQGLTDRMLFSDLLPGERTGLYASTAATNTAYRKLAGDRIAFFYLNVSRGSQTGAPAIARIEVPGWVAADAALLDIVQSALYENCAPAEYPYVLARAHELALVQQEEREVLESMIAQAMMRHRIFPQTSPKAANKRLTTPTRRWKP